MTVEKSVYRSNCSEQSQQEQTARRTNQNSEQLPVACSKRGKKIARTRCDWFWFCLIGWKTSARSFSQSLSLVRQSSENCCILTNAISFFLLNTDNWWNIRQVLVKHTKWLQKATESLSQRTPRNWRSTFCALLPVTCRFDGKPINIDHFFMTSRCVRRIRTSLYSSNAFTSEELTCWQSSRLVVINGNGFILGLKEIFILNFQVFLFYCRASESSFPFIPRIVP